MLMLTLERAVAGEATYSESHNASVNCSSLTSTFSTTALSISPTGDDCALPGAPPHTQHLLNFLAKEFLWVSPLGSSLLLLFGYIRELGHWGTLLRIGLAADIMFKVKTYRATRWISCRSTRRYTNGSNGPVLGNTKQSVESVEE